MKDRWKFISEARVFEDSVLSVRHRLLEFTPKGISAPFTIVDTKDWVVTIATDADGRFIMVRQYRFASEEVTLEFPGGALNRGEEPVFGAVRELREETGYVPKSVCPLGVMEPNPSFINNRCHVFLCEDCEPNGAQSFDPFEDVELVLVSEAELFELVRTGGISHGVVLAALSQYLLNR